MRQSLLHLPLVQFRGLQLISVVAVQSPHRPYRNIQFRSLRVRLPLQSDNLGDLRQDLRLTLGQPFFQFRSRDDRQPPGNTFANLRLVVAGRDVKFNPLAWFHGRQLRKVPRVLHRTLHPLTILPPIASRFGNRAGGTLPQRQRLLLSIGRHLFGQREPLEMKVHRSNSQIILDNRFDGQLGSRRDKQVGGWTFE